MSLVSISTDLINNSGYAGLALGLVVNAIGVPIPSELIIGLAGLGIKVGTFSWPGVLIVSVFAQVVGLLVSYTIARYGGVALIERYGKYVLIRQREIQTAERAFGRYGGRLVIFGLCLPALHGYVGYPAGLAKMNLGRFVIFAAIGSLIWTVILALLGFYLGSHLDTIDAVLHRFGLVVVALLILAIAWWINRHRRMHDSAREHIS